MNFNLNLLGYLILAVVAWADELDYLGCYLKDEATDLHKVKESKNGTEIPVFPFSSSIQTVQQNNLQTTNSDLDLSFSDLEHGLTVFEEPHQCKNVCYKNSFRYAGVYSAYGSLKCICGSNYGRFGIGRCLKCIGTTGEYCGSSDSVSVYDTGFKVPSSPQKLVMMSKGENTLRIRWTKPKATNGPLTSYKIHSKPLFSYSNNPQLMHERQWQVSDVEEEITLTGLATATEYSISVTAVNSEGPSLPTTDNLWTKIGAPDLPSPPEIIEQDSNTMTLKLSPIKNTKGPISMYRILLVDDLRLGFFSKDRNITWKEATTDGYPQYIAAEFNTFPGNGHFIVGDGQFYGEFFNGPLPKGHWHPSLGILSTMQGVTEISYSATSHDQHQFILPETISKLDNKKIIQDIISKGAVKSKDERRTEIIMTENTVVVTALWISIGITGIILLICASIFTVLKLELFQKRRRRSALTPSFSRALNIERPTELTICGNSPYIFPDNFNGGYTHSGFIPDDDMKGRVLDKLKEVWYIPRNFMAMPREEEVRLIGKGNYGPVYASTIKSNNEIQSPVKLYVIPDSLLKPNEKVASVECGDKFFQELNDLVRIESHENVVKLIGFMEDEDSLLFATEFVGSSLKEWLLDFRTQFQHDSTIISAEPSISYRLLLCAMNIAEAMFHLSSLKVTHGSLACCNVLVSKIEVPKVTGFGILKMDPPDQQRDYTRWSAVEQFQNRCIKPCDIWSFGILLWELMTLGGTPYNDIRKQDLSTRICRGNRPQQNPAIGDPLYQIMLNCWQIDRDERPDFGSLSCSIHELLPYSKENLFISSTFTYPPYISEFEYFDTSVKTKSNSSNRS